MLIGSSPQSDGQSYGQSGDRSTDPPEETDGGLFDVGETSVGAGPGPVPSSPRTVSGGGAGTLAGNTHASAPLAVRVRPRTLEELAGQQHLLTPGSPLRRLVEGDQPMSLLLWGPPGTGKTTLASILSGQTSRLFVEVSAVAAGVKEVRAAIDGARSRLARGGPETVLFVDEVHRFTKAQQDALLPGVENRWVTLVAATTENPFFSVISPLLSRSLLLTLEPLTDDDVRTVVDRALLDERGLAGAALLDDDARDHLVRLAGGDARRALTYLEAAAGAAGVATGSAGAGDHSAQAGPVVIDLRTAETAVDRAAVRYDRQGDQHYDVISAFIKSVRGSDADAALHYLARMIEAGEDPRFIARRLVVLASEDIGLADPTALTTAVAAAQTVQLIGMPEARLQLAQATIALSLAPKSNAVILAIDAASADVRAGKVGTVPSHLRDAHYGGSKKLGHGTGYRYAHDEPFGVAEQQYAPDVVADATYYRPTTLGAEAAVKERWAPAAPDGARPSGLTRAEEPEGRVTPMDPVLGATAAGAACLGVLVAVLVLLALQAPGRRRDRAQLTRTRSELEELRARVDRVDRLDTGTRPGQRRGAADHGAGVAPDGADSGRTAAPEWLITSMPEPGTPDEEGDVHRLTGRQFADVAVGESLLKIAAFAHGVRRAASAESRNRIRFEMAREVKRSRRQRRRDLKAARRHLREADRESVVLTEDAA